MSVGVPAVSYVSIPELAQPPSRAAESKRITVLELIALPFIIREFALLNYNILLPKCKLKIYYL